MLVAVVNFLIELPQRIGDVRNDLDLDWVGVVDFGRPKVDMDYLLTAVLVPSLGAEFNKVVTHRDHHVGGIDRGVNVVTSL